ncbi:Pol protein [Pyrenophora tritici-repentis]|nr:Pol protein [Pyrenophora tritici-repentis]
MDGDVGYGRAEAHLGSSAQEELSSAGIKVEIRSPNTPAQLGGAERAGAVIVTVARVIRIHAGLPKALANELVCTAVRLLNVTPTKALEWRTPQEIVTGIQLDLSRLHVIGSRGFILDKHLLRGDKLEKRTFEGFLIGYDASNIYREKPSTTPVEPRIIETVHIPKEEYDGDTIVVAQPVRQRQEAITTPVLPLDHVSEKEYNGDTIAVYQKPVRQLLSPSPTPAFEGQDRSPSPDPVEQQLLQESSALMDSSPHRTPGGWNNYDDDAEIYIPDRHQNNAPQRRDPNLSQDNIITSRRRRQAHYIEAAPDLSKYFAFSATIAQANDAISAASQPTRSDPTRIHRDDLPPPPRHWKELKRHAHGKQFEATAYAEFNSCWKKGTFAKLDITADTTDAVPLMWVFTYKFNEDGYLLKYKARLVVQGDLQEQYGDTYAATLAARLFRALMALACAFNLKAMQYDVPNAFLNANIDRTLYMRTPDGFQDRYGPNLRLLRALYGLKEAPRL